MSWKSVTESDVPAEMQSPLTSMIRAAQEYGASYITAVPRDENDEVLYRITVVDIRGLWTAYVNDPNTDTVLVAIYNE